MLKIIFSKFFLSRIFYQFYLLLFLIVFCFPINSTIGQEKSKDTTKTHFRSYNNLYQETAHVHINKSIYLKGEVLGFTSYLFDKKSNTFSLATKNLYCVIVSEDNKVIKEKLIEVKNGIAANIFEIDSSFTEGIYTLKAYTNWMLNFKQQNYSIQKFKVIDLESENKIKKVVKKFEKVDLQFLPEGGHFIDNISTTVGVIAKDSIGAGVPNLKGNVYDNSNQLVNTFTLNHLGIGQFSMTPDKTKNYVVALDINEERKMIPIQNKIENEGVSLKVLRIKNNVFISITTNEASTKYLKNNSFFLNIYDGKQLKKLSIQFTEKLNVTKKIPLKELSPGLNIFTLINDKNIPVSERLFFNYNGVSLLKSTISKIKNIGLDSLEVQLNYKNYSSSNLNSLSVSILPYNTKSYSKENNIIFQSLIQPYLNGPVENADYYFTDIDEKKMYDLDNLLLTQGWSSYDWHDLFSKEKKITYFFEDGIDLKINVNGKKARKKYLVRQKTGDFSQFFEITEEDKSLNSSNYYPKDNDSLLVSEINDKGKLFPASVNIQYSPNSFPNLYLSNSPYFTSENYYASENYVNDTFFRNSLSKTQELAEFSIKVDLEKERINKIVSKNYGSVYFFEEDKGYNYGDIIGFLRSKGFGVERIPGSEELAIFNLQASTTLNGENNVTIFIDDFLLVNTSQLLWLDFKTVDYIVINKSGTGEGIQGAGGTIKVYTDPFKVKKYDRKTTSVYPFPITFNSQKNFYTPKYLSYTSKFYQYYGTIDWLPINRINNDGNLILKFKNPQKESIKLFIEGFTNKGDYILEQKTINIPEKE